MALTAVGGGVTVALIVKALPMATITPMIASMGKVGAEGIVTVAASSHAVQNWFRELLNVRQGVDGADLLHMHTTYKLEAARSFLENMVSCVASGPDGKAYRLHQVQQAEAALIEGRTLLQSAGAVTMPHKDHKDPKEEDLRSLWPHLLHCHHLLICVTYWHASNLGENPVNGFRTAVNAINNMFADFYHRRQWAQAETFYRDSKTKQVDDHYGAWGGRSWERQIECLQRQGSESHPTFTVQLINTFD